MKFSALLTLLFCASCWARNQRQAVVSIPQSLFSFSLPDCDAAEEVTVAELTNTFLAQTLEDELFPDTFRGFEGRYTAECLDGTFTTIATGDLTLRTTIFVDDKVLEEESQQTIAAYYASDGPEDYFNLLEGELMFPPTDVEISATITMSPSASVAPSDIPSQAPSFAPSVSPSLIPSDSPSSSPSSLPSIEPSVFPSSLPTISTAPTSSPMPSNAPSTAPSVSPTVSQAPTTATMAPSSMPTSLTVIDFLPTRSAFALPTTCEETSPEVIDQLIDDFYVEVLSTKTNRDNYVAFQGDHGIQCSVGRWTIQSFGNVILTSGTDAEQAQKTLNATLTAYYNFKGEEDLEAFLVEAGYAPKNMQIYPIAIPPTDPPTPAEDDDGVNLGLAVGIPLGFVALLAVAGIFVYARKLRDDEDDIMTVPPPPPANPPSPQRPADTSLTKVSASSTKKDAPVPVIETKASGEQDSMSVMSDVMTVTTNQAAAYQAASKV